MVHNDPEVRESILRYVREGGGLGGNHAVTYANLNWPEFADMMGGWAGQHRVEEQVLKIDDPNSPLMKPFGSRAVHAHRRVLHLPAVLAVLARETARADEHRRREIGSRIRRAVQRAQHAARSGLRRSVGEGLRQRPHRTSRRSATRRSCTPTSGGPATCLPRFSISLGDLPTDETPSAKVKRTN